MHFLSIIQTLSCIFKNQGTYCGTKYSINSADLQCHKLGSCNKHIRSPKAVTY